MDGIRLPTTKLLARGENFGAPPRCGPVRRQGSTDRRTCRASAL